VPKQQQGKKACFRGSKAEYPKHIFIYEIKLAQFYILCYTDPIQSQFVRELLAHF